ncbi:aminopeptidase, partial [Flavobacterium sp.]|uniref:aminopeptidase n=1 Tax=Flavobacterium sp. TaxID=239 RepID=UPI0026277350
MRTIRILTFLCIALLASIKQYGQHRSQLFVTVNDKTHSLEVKQELYFVNDTGDSLDQIVLNDWNNAYANVNSPLAKRFSDEFYRGFHLSSSDEKGSTGLISIIGPDNTVLPWQRSADHPDVITLALQEKLAPQEEIQLSLTYTVKIPSDKFTRYGYSNTGTMVLKNWFLTPARYENHQFISYSNENLDDSANAPSDFDLELLVDKKLNISTDLNVVSVSNQGLSNLNRFTGENRTDFSIFLEPKASFYSFKTNSVEVVTNLKDENLNTIQQARVIDCVSQFVTDLIGTYPHKKIIVSQTDYDRNPFYGLNQLPSFIRPFSDEFTYELKFLKTYLNAFLKNSLQIDQRKDSWVLDGIQVYAMMQFIEKNHPNTKMLGSASSFKLLKSFNLAQLDFNEQYSYFYMIMARKNLDQPLEDNKNTLLKFNEQIASKYRSGLSLRYLDSYVGQQVVPNSIRNFYELNLTQQTTAKDFESILKTKSTQNIDWFFNSIIKSRQIVDYKIASVSKSADSVSFTLKNKTGLYVPIPIYGVHEGEIVFKKWLEPKTDDQLYSLERKGADKLVLNYKNEVPEYNLRNNWKSLKGFFPNNRPIKFAFMKDIEDPYYNQILYVPTLTYNLYDGLIPGMRLHNK